MGDGMVTTSTEITKSAVTDPNGSKPSRQRRPRASATEESNSYTRYFLAKANGNDGIPDLDREVTSEGEALVEALRLGVTYYAVQEFRAVPDFSGSRPQLTKEAVVSK